MSRKIVVQTEIRDTLILKDTLKQMGHAFTETNAEIIEMRRSYNSIQFNTKTGSVSFDDAQTNEVNTIKQAYAVNFYRDQAIKEGNQIQEVKRANGEIEIRILN
jgi:hypothetical protein